jgi:signal transduction histidine kinase
MLGLLNNLLDVSTIESGKFDIVLKSGNLKEVIESRVKLFSLSAKGKEIEITTALENVHDVEFDKERLSQVLDNLISNAIKFSNPGTTIHISLERINDKVSFHVRDQGPGIPQEDVGKIFGSFEKLDNKPTAGEKSTGLGMAIVKKIIDGHKGQISIESELGKGTEFTVSLFAGSNNLPD